jgi:hypothetical protein
MFTIQLCLLLRTGIKIYSENFALVYSFFIKLVAIDKFKCYESLSDKEFNNLYVYWKLVTENKAATAFSDSFDLYQVQDCKRMSMVYKSLMNLLG